MNLDRFGFSDEMIGFINSMKLTTQKISEDDMFQFIKEDMEEMKDCEEFANLTDKERFLFTFGAICGRTQMRIEEVSSL